MKNLRPEEENIIKDKRNLFRLKKELNYTEIEDVRNLFNEKYIEYLEILGIFLSMKKKIIIHQ